MAKVNDFQLTSVIEFPQRSQFGDNKWRGNMDGRELAGIINYTGAKSVVEIFGGSGTGYDVCQAMGLKDSIHLDLNPNFGQLYQGPEHHYVGKVGGWDATKDEIPYNGNDLLFAHPPYHSIIAYSGNMWGEKHPSDLSHCKTYEEFLAMLNLVNAKMYSAVKRGGRVAILVGDIKVKGQFRSIIKDMNYYGTLESHMIKVQHNASSYKKNYNGRFIPIQHEHLLLFKKEDLWAIPIKVVTNVLKTMMESKVVTWRELVRTAVEYLGGAVQLKQLYELLKDSAKAKNNPNWEAKIRQTLQIYKEFASVSRGNWSLQAVA